MYSHRLVMQDPSDAATRGSVLMGIRDASVIGQVVQFRAAVAYASRKGVRMLSEALAECDWEQIHKQWLISIDFGQTEPQALQEMMEMANSEVRIPNGRLVVSSHRFDPTPACFHPKIYVFGASAPDGAPIGMFAGSANLTGSGLELGYEAGVVSTWQGSVQDEEPGARAAARKGLNAIDRMWEYATPVEEIIEAYVEKRKALTRPPQSEEQTEVRVLVDAPEPRELPEDVGVAFTTARKLWVRTDELYHNLTTRGIGNQLDLPRGTRVFFGFPVTEVPRNSRFGTIIVQCPGFEPTRRNMRFGNNFMDKLNLPIPGEAGPSSYDHSILLFEKVGFSGTGIRKYSLELISEKRLAVELNAPNLSLAMSGGRQYGVIY